jgi:hypothetical protein
MADHSSMISEYDPDELVDESANDKDYKAAGKAAGKAGGKLGSRTDPRRLHKRRQTTRTTTTPTAGTKAKPEYDDAQVEATVDRIVPLATITPQPVVEQPNPDTTTINPQTEERTEKRTIAHAARAGNAERTDSRYATEMAELTHSNEPRPEIEERTVKQSHDTMEILSSRDHRRRRSRHNTNC